MKVYERPIIGWREWIALPQLGIDKLRCKVDTGAKTSALHAFYVEPYEQEGLTRVKFGLHPDENSTSIEKHCEAVVIDQRNVTDSGGHTEQRFVIQTNIVLGERVWPTQITLTNRDTMKHRMLFGRTAILDYFLIDSSSQHLMGLPGTSPQTQVIHPYLHTDEEEE